jgi:hypothetical protein
MIQTLRSARQQLRTLVPAAIGAWLVTLFVGLGGGIAEAAARGSSSIGELVGIYAPVMGIPFALSTGAVLLPMISACRLMVGPGRPWLLAFVGVSLAPVQALVLLIAGRITFQGGPHMRPTLWADLGAIAAHPADTVVLLVAFAAGGVTLGMWAARRRELLMGDTPANNALEPTARVSSS